MKKVILGIVLAFATSLANSASVDFVNVSMTVSKENNQVAQFSERVTVGEGVNKCVGTEIKYPADLSITNKRTCNGMMVKIDPLLPAQKSVSIAFNVEYSRLSNRVSTLDPRLPTLDVIGFKTTYDAKPGEKVELQTGGYVLSVLVSY